MNVQIGAFEVDVEGRRLLKAGLRIPLREQPFQVLTALLEKPGEMVTREELRNRLWPQDTFVDFEVALNSAVSRLRRVLGDSVESPRFIETVPKRGYRWIAPVAKKPSVAVLPFVSENANVENEYLSDGLTDELIGELARIEGLRVAARSVVFRLKGQTYDISKIGREFGVQAILEGVVRKAGERIRVTVHLVDVKEGFDLWAERFDSELNDGFAIQDQVCENVAKALKVSLANRIPQKRAANPQAYKLYLQGHHFTKIGRPDALRRGLECFLESIRLDPGYPLPYHGAALFYVLGALYGAMPSRIAFSEAESLVSKGLGLDEHSAMLQTTLGMLRMFQWRWAEAEQAYLRAIRLEPSNFHPRMMHAILCSFLGRHEDGLRQANKAVELDPLDMKANFQLLQCLYFARRYEEAVRCGYTALEVAPGSHFTYSYLAWSLAAIGLKDEAWRIANAGRALSQGQPLADGQFGYTAAILGYTEEAGNIALELEARREKAYIPAAPIAWIHLGLGDTTAGIKWLEIAFDEAEPILALIKVFPGYDSIRGEPRFRQLASNVVP